ncbi:MAG: histidine triad family protein [Patescibacteria group bacterium]|nr:histidine triad family protein [Patescibacteria group bacterium]
MCIFCQIIEKTIPASIFYEDEATLAFLDIKPVNPGHALVIPKKHVANLEEISAADLATLIKVVKKVGKLLETKLGVAGYNLVVNNGSVAGQEIAHLHFHLIPRQANDGFKFFPTQGYKTGEKEEILKKLLS